jgi:hypothetical protein
MNDCTIVVYDASTGVRERELRGHLAPVLSLTFADDPEKKEGDILFSSSADGQVRVWNVALGACLRVLAGHLDATYRVFYSATQHKCWSLAEDGLREWQFDRLTVMGVTGLDGGGNNNVNSDRGGLLSSTATTTMASDAVREFPPMTMNYDRSRGRMWRGEESLGDDDIEEFLAERHPTRSRGWKWSWFGWWRGGRRRPPPRPPKHAPSSSSWREFLQSGRCTLAPANQHAVPPE